MLKSGKVPCAFLLYASTRRLIKAFNQGKCVGMLMTEMGVPMYMYIKSLRYFDL